MTRTTPSHRGLTPALPTASRIKARNGRSDTRAEILLHQALQRGGLRYRKNVAILPGKPDIVLPGRIVVVFCDGALWHGRNWPAHEAKLARGANPNY